MPLSKLLPFTPRENPVRLARSGFEAIPTDLTAANDFGLRRPFFRHRDCITDCASNWDLGARQQGQWERSLAFAFGETMTCPTCQSDNLILDCPYWLANEDAAEAIVTCEQCEAEFTVKLVIPPSRNPTTTNLHGPFKVEGNVLLRETSPPNIEATFTCADLAAHVASLLELHG